MATACAAERHILAERFARRRVAKARAFAVAAAVVVAWGSRAAFAIQSAAESRPLGAPAAPVPAGGAGDMLRLAVALVVVVGLAFAGRWWIRRSGLVERWQGGAFEVLGRRAVGRGQSVLVARFGGRVLLLQQSRDGLRTLSEVADPAEASAILAQSRPPSATSTAERTVDLRRNPREAP